MVNAPVTDIMCKPCGFAGFGKRGKRYNEKPPFCESLVNGPKLHRLPFGA
jgi:hypothetical protein